MSNLYNPKDSIFETHKLGISKSLNIMINFSEIENIKYDKIIVYRPDVILFKDMNLNFYKNDNNIL